MNRRSIRQSKQIIPGQQFEWQAESGESPNDRRAFAVMRELETGKVGMNSDGSFIPGSSTSSGTTTTIPSWVNGDFGIGAPPPTNHRLHVEEATSDTSLYAITGITKAASAVITIGASHTVGVGALVTISGVLGMVEINGLSAAVTAIGATTITVSINSTGFSTYTSGGTAEVDGGAQQFYFTTSTTVNSGLRGLHLRKSASNQEPVGLTLEYETGPVWDTIAIDAFTRDLVLAYSHDLKADNFRFRSDSAQLAFGRVVGQPASGGAQFQIQSGTGQTITGLSTSTNAVVTVASTLGFRVGDTVTISGITAPAGLASAINGTTATVTALTSTTLTTTFNTSAFGAWTTGGSVYVQTDGISSNSWGNAISLLLLQGLPNTVTRRTKVQFGIGGALLGSDASQNGTNDWFLFHGSAFAQYVSSAGLVFIGGGGSPPTPTAKLHLGAGAAAASGAPLKFTSGTNLTTPEAGAVEYDGTEWTFTRSSTRFRVLLDTLTDGTNIATGTTTGTQIATSTSQKLGVWGASPVARPAAYTQNYTTTTRTVNAYTSDPESSAYTGIDNAQGGTVYAQLTDLNSLRVAYETLRASHDNLISAFTQVLDDLQLIGLAG